MDWGLVSLSAQTGHIVPSISILQLKIEINEKVENVTCWNTWNKTTTISNSSIGTDEPGPWCGGATYGSLDDPKGCLVGICISNTQADGERLLTNTGSRLQQAYSVQSPTPHTVGCLPCLLAKGGGHSIATQLMMASTKNQGPQYPTEGGAEISGDQLNTTQST